MDPVNTNNLDWYEDFFPKKIFEFRFTIGTVCCLEQEDKNETPNSGTGCEYTC